MSLTAGARLHGGALHHRRQCSNQSSVGRRVAIVRSFRERGAPSTHRHHGPELVSRHIHIFTTPAVRVQHKVTVHLIVKTVKTTLERCGPFSLVVLSQRRSHVTSLSGHSDQNASETFSNKPQLNKVQSSLRQTSAKTTQVRSKAKTS